MGVRKKREEPAAAPQRAKPGTRARQAQDTRALLLKTAITVFAQDGFAGGRIEKISRLAKSHDRMIYYYFGSKEKLFVEVLETIYSQLNEAEAQLEFDFTKPLSALKELIHFTWRYYLKHPEFVSILNSENLHRGKHSRKSEKLGALSGAALSILEKILKEGKRQKLIAANIQARDVYIMIASLGYFYNSNRFTLSAFLEADLMEEGALRHWEEFMTTMILAALTA